jgi:hypothetical protein
MVRVLISRTKKALAGPNAARLVDPNFAYFVQFSIEMDFARGCLDRRRERRVMIARGW